QGIITGQARGVTTIETQVLWGGIIRTLKTSVFVEDAIESLEFSNVIGDARKLILGETLELEAYGLTELGKKVAFDSVTYVSSNEEVFSLSTGGLIEGLSEGEALITVTAIAGESEFVRTVHFEVIQYSSVLGLTHSPYYLNDKLADVDNW